MSNYDLLQTGPRVRRLVSSTVAALVTCGVLAPIFWNIIDPEVGFTGGPYMALFFFLATASAVAFFLTNFVLRRRDDRQWHEPAKATARTSAD